MNIWYIANITQGNNAKDSGLVLKAKMQIDITLLQFHREVKEKVTYEKHLVECSNLS